MVFGRTVWGIPKTFLQVYTGHRERATRLCGFGGFMLRTGEGDRLPSITCDVGWSSCWLWRCLK